MWNLIFVLFLSVTGCLAQDMDLWDDCDRSKCNNSPLPEPEGVLPTTEELKIICPPLLEHENCHMSAIEACTGTDFQELAASDNTSVSSKASLLLALKKLTVDVCDEESQFHADYASSEACFNEVMVGPKPNCHKDAVTSYRTFKELSKLIEESVEEKRKDAACLMKAYSTACLTLEIREKCGEQAGAFIMEVLKQVKYMSYSSGSCSPEQLTILRSDFLEFLKFGEEKKEWFSQVFNTRK